MAIKLFLLGGTKKRTTVERELMKMFEFAFLHGFTVDNDNKENVEMKRLFSNK